eukprot:GEMP01062030.1.p1 GENE.GEMP01062030.1~~GEMP01062030.1.p1  ORF type:complete len:241 (+),score=25.66 GEMP01062030.1:38-760(+)
MLQTLTDAVGEVLAQPEPLCQIKEFKKLAQLVQQDCPKPNIREVLEHCQAKSDWICEMNFGDFQKVMMDAVEKRHLKLFTPEKQNSAVVAYQNLINTICSASIKGGGADRDGSRHMKIIISHMPNQKCTGGVICVAAVQFSRRIENKAAAAFATYKFAYSTETLFGRLDCGPPIPLPEETDVEDAAFWNLNEYLNKNEAHRGECPPPNTFAKEVGEFIVSMLTGLASTVGLQIAHQLGAA